MFIISILLFDLFVLFYYIVPIISKEQTTKVGKADAPPQAAAASAVQPGPNRENAKAAFKAAVVNVRQVELPPPDYLLEEAKKERNKKLLLDYSDTICLLRDEKGFTFREIAEWLTVNGVDTDHNAVYRAYIKGMPEEMVAQLDHIIDAVGEAL